MKYEKFDFSWPFAALFGLMAALVIAGALGLIHRFDSDVLRREQAVVDHGLAARSEEVAHMVVTQVVWDEAVRNLDNRYDPSWAKDNIGQFLSQADGFAAAFVLDAGDRPLFSSIRGAEVGADRYAPYARVARPLVASVRSAESRRGRLSAPVNGQGMIAAPLQSSAFGRIGSGTYLITATLVQPDFGNALPRGERAPVVVTAMSLDDAFLKTFSNRFMLRDLALAPGASAFAAGKAAAALVGQDGQPVARLTWLPQTPGAQLLRQVILPILAVMAALGVLTLVIFRRGRRAAQGLIASEARASHLAYHDPLTGLANRVLFFDRLANALEVSRRNGSTVAVHCIDLDRFKEVNDTYGHQAGDDLIRAAAQRLAGQCRASDTFARLSGDEFAVVQVDANAASAAKLAARLVEVMAEPVEIAAGRMFVGASVGVTLVEAAAIDGAEALRQADLALYRAKDDGRSRFCLFEIEMDAAVKTRRILENDLRDALRNGGLDLVYQPQVNNRNEVIGVESLLRWNHPERGAVSPAYFVQIAEECGLILELGRYVMVRAFEESKRWPGLKVGVNVSAAQLRSRDFINDVTTLIEQAGVSPRSFELEITEGVLLGDDPLTHDTLKRLRQMGFSIALDDFGTGYSSLSYLRNYPVNKIKIDRSFITSLGIDAEAESVIAAIVRLARALKLDVIAEGVETDRQRKHLASAGCGEIQGFLFSQPLRPDGVDQLIAAHEAAGQPA